MLMLQSIQLPDLLNVTCSSEIMICYCFMAEYYLFLAFLPCNHKLKYCEKDSYLFVFYYGFYHSTKRKITIELKLETELY